EKEQEAHAVDCPEQRPNADSGGGGRGGHGGGAQEETGPSVGAEYARQQQERSNRFDAGVQPMQRRIGMSIASGSPHLIGLTVGLFMKQASFPGPSAAECGG